MLDAFKRGKVSKVMFSVLSLLMLTISTLISPIFAHADDGEPNVVQRASGNWTQMWHEKYNNKGWVYDAGQKYSIETDVIRFGDNSIAYCLEMMLESPNGHSLEEKTRLSDEYYKIMNNGYPVKTPEQLGANSWQEAHYATQVAVWIVNQDVKYSNLTFKNANVKQVVDKILADANNSSDTQDLSFSITPDHIKAEMTPWSTEYRQAGPFTIKTNGNGTFKPEAINAPGKVTFVDSMGNPKTELNSWEPFFAQINSNTPTGSFNIKVTGDMTKTETVWYKSHSGGIQHTTALVTLHKTPTAQNASISWDSNGGFKIKKVDDAGNPLGGAKFDVINWGNQVVRSLTTDSNGMASTDGLWFEDYTVKETQAPDGYELDNTPQKVTVDSKDKTLTFVNRKSKGGFRIHKVDDSNKPLQGVVFTIYGNDGLKMFDRTTDANGIIQLGDLPYGEYHFKESKGLDGYEFDDDVKHITINADSQNKEYKVVNKLISGSIKITKTDEENRPLKGVQFLVYNQNGDVVGEAYTNEQGIATMGNLPYGTYAWLENKGLDGYEAEKKTGSFVVGKDQKDHAVTVINKRMKGGLEIYKIDDSHQPLQGVEFTIYKDGKEFKKVTTGKDGKIKLPDLEFGKYSVKETKGLEGYVTDFKEESFELSSQNRSKSMVVVNKKIKGSLEITKTDDASKPLAGVQFTIYKDGKEYEQITTDANGKIVLNDLPMGKYTFKETRGLEGYVVSTKEEAFEIKNLGDSKKFTVVNKAIKGSIEITKTDDASKPLKGVEFTVYKDGKEYTKVTTNDKGIAEVKDLPYGSYTFKETKGIEGYVPDSTTKGVDIKEDGKTHKYTVINKKIKGNLEITKTDDAKKPLKGVEFTVYDAKDKEVAKVVTDDKGKASVKDLPYGKYYFKETKGLEGYVFSKEKVEFEIKNLNETKSYNVVNKLIRSNIEITKVDNEGKLLEGVEFTIYDSNDKEVAKVVTDAQGKAKYENLPYGKYYFKETKNLEGYVKNGTKYDIDVKQDMQTLKYDVINKKIRGSVEVLKVDADKKEKPLQGVEFTLFDQNNKVVGKPKLTDKDGKVSFDKLAFGKYYIKETKTIKGYNINNEKFPVDIDTDGKVVKHTVTNKVIRGNVELLKVDTENKNVTLKGAEFELRGSNDEVLGKYKTDANGKLVIKDLVFGDYKLIETIAPTGFNLEQTPISFSISEEGKTIGLTKENLKIYGNMEVTKVDAEDNKKVLANAKFEVYNEKGDKVVEGTTDAKGKAKFEHLPYGKYTFKEVVAPEGYLVNPTVFNFDILENGKTVSHKVTDQIIKGDLEVKKVDMADKKGLSDAKFEVFNAEGKKVAEGKTNKDGYAKFEKLPYGKYTFKETVAPKGYFLNETVFNFEIKEDGKIIAQVVENEKVPSIKTTATEKHDGAKEMHTSKEVTITDKVEYKDLLIGKEYTVKGKLMDKETKKPLLVGGKEVTAEATFTPDKATGSINLDFTFDATGLEEKEVVVFEDLIKEGKTLTTHSDLEDKDQTVKFVKPSVSTTATDKADGTKELHAIKDVTIIDVVEYKNLVVGKNYTLKGKLMDKATKQPLVIDGKEVVAEKNFSPREKDGKVPLEFKIDASTLEGKQVVVFEDVVHNNFVIATHADIEDKGQTVDFVKPEVKTTATNKADKEKEIHAIKNITVQDKVDYKNLVVGKEYTVKGKLMVKETNKPLVIEGKEVTAEKTFKPTAKNGSVTLDFTFDASKLEGKELVVFEDVVFNKTTIATHSDIEDKDQTVRVVKPEVHTTATNKADEGKEIHAQEKVTIQDKVAYKDLVKGKEYTVKGKLMDKATNKPFKVDGKEVTAESKFTAKEKDGVVTVDFTFNAEKLQGKSLVVFEDLYYEKELIATHSDIKDEGQTVRIVKPEVKTTATNKADEGKEIHADQTVTIQDKVEYKDLIIGKEYTVKGKLMDKATNKPLLVNDKEVTAESKFKAEAKDGSIILDFTFDAKALQGKEVVVFEDLYNEKLLVATHSEIEDKDQTVKFVKPEVKTTATNKADELKEVHSNREITLKDVVEYKDLIVGKEYTVKGKLIDKGTEKPFLVNDKEVTSEAKFIAEAKDGSITLDFTFEAKDVEGKDIVVFEDLYQDSLLVATHSDIEDKGQTVNFVKPEVKTTATNKEDGLKNIHSNKTVTIQDKVEYKDLIVGKEYVVKGKLMDKATNEPFLVDGKEVTSETKFTAEDKNGSVILDFTFEAKGVEGKEVVVFEDLYNEDILIATHSDIEDKDQTVEFVKPEVGTKATNKADGGKELHTNKSVTIQDTVDYKGLIVDKEYVVKGKLMDKETNKPLLVNDKEVTAEAKFTAKKETGSVTLDFTFDATGLEGKEVVVFEDLYQDNVLVATHSDITDEGQTVKFVKPEVKTTATNKENGSKELDANKSVTVTDKVEYHDLIVGKEYVVKGKLMDKATNKPLIINGIEVTSETKFTAKEKNGSVNLDFTFDATELQGKELVVFEDLYQDNVLVATHSDINDVNQTVKVKVKPVQPKPEQPKPEQPKPQKKPVPQTGSDSNFGTTMSILMGIIALALGGVFVFTRKNKAE